jgi:hypothetical protein
MQWPIAKGNTLAIDHVFCTYMQWPTAKGNTLAIDHVFLHIHAVAQCKMKYTCN